MDLLLRVSALVLLLAAPPAFGMCISTKYEPVAWSPDGQAAVVQVAATGPEGGGSITYVVIDFKKDKSEALAVSSNFSQGDGDEPQTITDEACRAAVGKGNRLLEKLGFTARFKTEPKACKKNRDDLVSGKDKKDYSLEFEKARETAVQIGLPGRGATAIAFSKNGKQSIVIENNESCEARCYRAKPGAKPDTYLNDGSCE